MAQHAKGGYEIFYSRSFKEEVGIGFWTEFLLCVGVGAVFACAVELLANCR